MKKMNLERRIIFFAFIILFLTILANTSMDIAGFRKDYLTALAVRCQSLGSSMKGSIEKVLGLGLNLKDLSGISEKCRELVQGDPEIAYCAISDVDGTVLFANDPSYYAVPANKVNTTFVMNHNQVNLIGEGTRYYDSPTPVVSPDGKVVATVHVGFQQKLITEKVAKMIFSSLVILLVFFLISFSLVVLFVKRGITQPISVLLSGVKKISEGSFDIILEKIPVYEFNKLGETINFMSTSLKSREEEIKKNYQELEGAHNDLHDSYLKLESLSMELEKSEELYKSLMEDSSDAIIVIGGTERVMMVNKMAEHFFAYTAEEVLDLPLTKLLLLLKVENIPRVHKLFNDALEGVHVVDEMEFTNKKEATVLGRIYASCIKSSGEKLVQVIFRDITREREIVKNLEKSAADLARLNKMKDSFLGVASHELKTPLTVIMGYAELLSTDMAGRMDKAAIEMVQNISNAALRLDSIVKDMVDVTMIDEKKLRLKLEEVNVNQLVENAISELRFFFSMRKQDVMVNLDGSIPPIKGDTLRLMQLLTNIFGNAIKFTPDGGRITISTGVQQLLRSRQQGSSGDLHSSVNIGKDRHTYVEIAISDTGIGIDREDQLRIFDKFYEVGNIEEHSSGKVAFKAKGAGLGLAIAKGIVEMHGGEIWVESEGCDPITYPGSTFHILFPLDPLIGDATLDYMNLLR